MRAVRIKRYITSFCYLLIFVFCFAFSAKIWTGTSNFLNQLLIDSGYRLEHINVSGQVNIQKDEILKKTEHFLGKNTFTLPIFSIRKELMKMEWCKDATVLKKMPNQLIISITEHIPFAVLNSSYIITEDFYKITEFNKENHKKLTLPAINATDYKKATNFIKSLRANLKQEDFAKITSLDLISGRRWDIIMQNGLLIKLPEKDPVQKFKQLKKYYGAKFSASKVLDARIPDAIYLI